VPPVLALGVGGQLVAIGEYGPKLRVIDLRSGARHVWTWAPPGAGGKREAEDLFREIVVTAVAFTSAGDGVVAVDRFGTISRWDLPGGRLRRRIPGICSLEEVPARTDVNDPDFRRICGMTHFAAISPKGDLVASSGFDGNVRVRDAGSGKLLASWASDVSCGELAFSRTGELAVVCNQGKLLRWRPGQTTLTVTQEYERSVSPEDRAGFAILGSRLNVLRAGEVVQWDLGTGERYALKLAADERSLGVVDEGKRAWVRAPEAVTLRDFRSGAEQLRVPVPRDVDNAREGESPPGHALLAVAVVGGWDHHVVGPGGVRVVRLDSLASRLTPDGRKLVEAAPGQSIRIWEVATGVQVHALASTAEKVAFAEDGAVMASISWDPERRIGEVRSRRLDDPGAAERVLEVTGRPLDLAVSMDGQEVLMARPRGLIRWSPGTGQSTEYPTRWRSRIVGVDITGGGATLMLTYADHSIEIRGNNEHMDLLAAVFPIGRASWVARGSGGAVDGSPDAPDSVLVRVERSFDWLMFDGRLAWHGAHVPGLVARAILGEDVQSPGILRAPLYEGALREGKRYEGRSVGQP